MKKVAVFGIGYVGCVTAACLARDGHQVIGIDVDPDKVAELNAGHSPISEPGLAELVSKQVRAGRLAATCDVRQAVEDSEIALIAVGTPSSEDGSVSSRAVEAVIRAIGSALRDLPRPYTVVVRSTLLPGILEDVLDPLLEGASGRSLDSDAIHLCNNPEFLREGTAIRDYDNPPFVVVGAAQDSAGEAVLELYSAVSAEKIVTDTRTAALVKYSCNAFHAVKVAFANEVGALARTFGASGHEVMELVCQDRRLNISSAYLSPGFAFGGSCLPKDLRAITRHAEREGLRVDLLASVLPSNESQVRRALRMVLDSDQRRIGLVGLSFKAGTDDLRESPLVILAQALLGRGFDLRIYDPGVSVSRLRGRNLAYVDRHLPHLAALMIEDPSELFAHAGLLVLGTNVADGLDWRTGFDGEVLDLRRDLALPEPGSEAAGWKNMAAPLSGLWLG
jgi:GDP-mannose 6-dehydrogenase